VSGPEKKASKKNAVGQTDKQKKTKKTRTMPMTKLRPVSVAHQSRNGFDNVQQITAWTSQCALSVSAVVTAARL